MNKKIVSVTSCVLSLVCCSGLYSADKMVNKPTVQNPKNPGVVKSSNTVLAPTNNFNYKLTFIRNGMISFSKRNKDFAAVAAEGQTAPVTDEEKARFVIEEIIAGPSDTEIKQGVESLIPKGTKILNLKITKDKDKCKIIYVEFSRDIIKGFDEEDKLRFLVEQLISSLEESDLNIRQYSFNVKNKKGVSQPLGYFLDNE